MDSISPLTDLAVVLSEDVLFQDLEGELVLLNTTTGEYFGLNHVGTTIWILLKEGWSIADIVQSLASRYEVTMERLLEDVGKFLNDMEANRLISIKRSHAEVEAD